MPGYLDEQNSWTYESHLFHPYDASGERGRWKKTWERAGPKFMRTDEEKKKHEDKKKKQERKDLRDRLHKMLRPYSKKSKEAKRKAQLKERRSVGSVAASSAAASSAPSNHVPLMSYLRPCNIIGGGFVCTRAGYIPRYVVAYWERHCRPAP